MKYGIKIPTLVSIVLYCLLLAVLPLKVKAEEISTGWITDPLHTPLSLRVTLTGETNLDNKTVEGFVEIKLDDDWKTYWRSPGEGGIAPSLDWSESKNITHVQWHWPAPKRYDFLGVSTIGYKDRVLFPLTLHIDNMDKPALFNGKLTMPYCKSICVLNDYDLKLPFQPNQPVLSELALNLYNQGKSKVPLPSSVVKLEKAFWDEAKGIAAIQVTHPQGWNHPDVFVDSSSDELKNFIFASPDISVNGNILIASFEVSNWVDTNDLSERTLPLVITDQQLALHVDATLGNNPLDTQRHSSLLTMIAIALLGGLILNAMPCVLPVLGMKLSSVISAQGVEKRQVRTQFIASAAGIIFSFWLLALFLSVLKFSGQALGWGVQFQSPYFIGFMVIITALFGANMIGLYEVRLSANTSTWIASRGNNSYTGHFVQGVFATLLATPCTAPFLGTAVAFALGSNYLELFLIFTSLAIGMASPWLLIATFPQMANLLPKPGRWMNTTKNVFGLMMLATSLWLISLMTNFLGDSLTLIIAGGFITILLWRLGKTKGKRPVYITLAFLSMFVASVSLLSYTTDHFSAESTKEVLWQPLDTQSIKKIS